MRILTALTASVLLVLAGTLAASASSVGAGTQIEYGQTGGPLSLVASIVGFLRALHFPGM